VAVGLIARRACRTLVLVHRRPLLEQRVTSLARFLGLEPSQIGVIGTREGVAGADVAMIQSPRDAKIAASCSAATATSSSTSAPRFGCISRGLLREIPCRYVTGLTATPRRPSPDHHTPSTSLTLH
jgi:superfamily II DNA or RNA helicase